MPALPLFFALVAAPLLHAADLLDKKPELIAVRKIWDKAPHNAFTDLVRFRNTWFCVFREGANHVSPDGAIRVLRSQDAQSWDSLALLTDPKADLRDPKLVVTPQDTLQLGAAAALHPPAQYKHQSLTWFSSDGRSWTAPIKIGDPNCWLWRITWLNQRAYAVGYDTTGENWVRLYSSTDGHDFQTLVPTLFNTGNPNETSLLPQPDGALLCLLRRDGPNANGMLGTARPPFTQWQWKDLGARIGGPHMLRLPDGRLIAALRLYSGTTRTSLAWINPTAGTLTECLKLPSSGDSSYPGLVWHDNQLWVSYYSSHEGKTSIYLAQIQLK